MKTADVMRIWHRVSPLLARSRPRNEGDECPLFSLKRTKTGRSGTSTYDPIRTSEVKSAMRVTMTLLPMHLQ
jgi:hypothetical protein